MNRLIIPTETGRSTVKRDGAVAHRRTMREVFALVPHPLRSDQLTVVVPGRLFGPSGLPTPAQRSRMSLDWILTNVEAEDLIRTLLAERLGMSQATPPLPPAKPKPKPKPKPLSALSGAVLDTYLRDLA